MGNNTENTSASTLRQIAQILDRHAVEYIVIGGQAEILMGSPRITYDVDLCYSRTPQNLQHLASALQEIQPTLRGAPPGLPFIIDARTLEMGSNFTFKTPIVDLDLLGWVEPIGDYHALKKNAIQLNIGDMDISVIDLDDLIRIKQHVGREKDKGSLLQLLAIKKIREETGQK
jgi:predicted nucleotidyltransferase